MSELDAWGRGDCAEQWEICGRVPQDRRKREGSTAWKEGEQSRAKTGL